MKRILTLTLLAAFALLVSASAIRAQGSPAATPTPTEEELRLQEEKRLLELQRDIEQAKKAIRDAQPQPSPQPSPPTPTTTPLAGDATLSEGVRLETEMVSYKAMSAAADLISEEVRSRVSYSATNVPNVAIYDAQVVKDWRFYQALFPAFDGQVKDLLNSYTKQLCKLPSVSDDFKAKYECAAGAPAHPFDETRATVTQLASSAIPGAFAAGTTLLKSFVDLAALFRTDTKIDGRAVTIDQSALVAEIFRGLKNRYIASKQNINLYYPGVFSPRLPSQTTCPNGQRCPSTVTTIGALYVAKIEADTVIEALNKEKKDLSDNIKDKLGQRGKLAEELDKVQGLLAGLKNLEDARAAEDEAVTKRRIEKEIAEVKTSLYKLRPAVVIEGEIKIIDENEDVKKAKARLNEIAKDVKALTDLNARFQTFVDGFVKVDANGLNALALFIKSEDIENAMPEGSSYWLEVRSVSAGGNNRVRKNLLRYLSGPKIDHSGGVIVEYTLYNRDGSVKYSDKLSYYEGYVEPKRIKDRSKFKDAVEP